jgi:hypothetical protein
MKIFLESIEGGQGLPFANLDVQCHGERVGRIRLPVDGAQTDIAAIGELLRDFSDCLVEWTRRGTNLVPAGENAYPELTATTERESPSPAGSASAERRIRR